MATRSLKRRTVRAESRSFSRVAPDLVLMDVAMPGMDGYEAARTMKANADDRHVPIIFLTAHSD